MGSCLTGVDIIDEIYSIKKPDEKFVLSAGHAHLAHLVVMEKYTPLNKMVRREMVEANAWPERMIEKYGIHCDSNICDASSGSLGQGLPIAVGMALADRSKNVYCLISDGECSEGSIWEALRIMREQKLYNLKIFININGWGAYKEIDKGKLQLQIGEMFLGTDGDWYKGKIRGINYRYTDVTDFPFLKGQDAHYKVMDENDYEEALKMLK